MTNKIYPYKAVENEDDDIADEVVFAAKIIDLREDGAPSNYKGFKEGDEVSKAHCIGIALNGANAPTRGKEIYEEIEAERKAFEAISPANHSTQTSFLDALDDASKYLNKDTWLARLKTKHNVSTWVDLKAACTPSE